MIGYYFVKAKTSHDPTYMMILKTWTGRLVMKKTITRAISITAAFRLLLSCAEFDMQNNYYGKQGIDYGTLGLSLENLGFASQKIIIFDFMFPNGKIKR